MWINCPSWLLISTTFNILFRTLVEQPDYIGIMKDLVSVYLLPILFSIIIIIINRFAPHILCCLHPQVLCPWLPRPLVLSGAPHFVALCVRLQGAKKVSGFSLLHCLIKFSGIESSSSLVSSHQVFMSDLWWASTPSFPQIQFFCTSISLAYVMYNINL